MNTAVFILNDFLNEIEKRPAEFVRGIIEAMGKGNLKDFKWVVGQTSVAPTSHADVPRLYVTHGNAMTDLSFSWDIEKASDSELAFLRNRARLAGSLLKSFNADLKREEEKRVKQRKKK